MPLNGSKSKANRRSRSRNTTPSTSTIASVETPILEPNPYTKLIGLASPQNVSLSESLTNGGGTSPSSIPTAASLNQTLAEVKSAASRLRTHEEGFEQVLREVVKRRPEVVRVYHEREAEEKRLKAKGTPRKKDGHRARDEERPFAVGAHGLARQDGIKDKEGSSSISSIASPEDAAVAAADAPEDPASPSTSSESHQPAAAPMVTHYQAFGPDPTKFDDPTIYHIREVSEDTPEELKKEIYSVAEYPHDDLYDLIAGMPPDKDFSNAKPANQISASVFANYVEPYIKPITEEDLAFLRERGDRVTPFIMPPLGPRHYKDIWAEEDGAMAIDSNKDKLPPNQARGSIDQITDEVAETDQVSIGPMASRLLSALRPEGSMLSMEAEMADLLNDTMDIDGLTNDKPPAPPLEVHPPATQLPEASQPGWKAAAAATSTTPSANTKMNYKEYDDRIAAELRYLGFVLDEEADGPNHSSSAATTGTGAGTNGSSSTAATNAPGTASAGASGVNPAGLPGQSTDYDAGYDDEVAARLRLLQSELRKQMIINGARKARIMELCTGRMAMQEYSNIADDLDNQINQAYLKRNRTMGKGKKGAKRPGAAAHVASAAGAGGKNVVGEPIRALLERKAAWNSMIGPTVNYGRGEVPTESIFDEATMKRLEARELEMWDQGEE